ncbi:alanine--tRNA ligase-related protein, partial [Candidatus Parcubacteria bacterium]|nr:alanine--tRNA ligase-related protein [Candidatus Parcubacteria bacterium]
MRLLMTARELIKKYIAFFVSKGHTEIPGASLVPENDPSALFTSAGMHPLVPFLMGEAHPAGQKLVNVQKCLRTQDIGEVGNPMHNTFFLMLGNWSLGEYFKEEAIGMSWGFLTQELRLDPGRISVTVFAGDENASRDEESAEIWKKIGLPDGRIYFLPKEDNWWGPIGETGPCGPDTEMFYDTGKEACGPDCRPGC